MSLSVPWKPADAVMDRVRALWPDAADERRVVAILGRLGPPYGREARESVACAVLKLAGRDHARMEELVAEARLGPEAVARLRTAAGFAEWLSHRHWIPEGMTVRRRVKIGWFARVPAIMDAATWGLLGLGILFVVVLLLELDIGIPVLHRDEQEMGWWPWFIGVMFAVQMMSIVYLLGRLVSRRAPVRFEDAGGRVGRVAGTWRDVAALNVVRERNPSLEGWMLVVHVRPAEPGVRPLPNRLFVPMAFHSSVEADAFLAECVAVQARAEVEGSGPAG